MRRAGPRVRAVISIRVLTEHVFCLVHDVLHLFDERLSLGRQDKVMLYLQRDSVALPVTPFHSLRLLGGSVKETHTSILP